MAEMHGQLAEAWVDSVRLRVRLGSHPIVRTHEKLLDAVGARLEAVGDDPLATASPEQLEAERASMETINRKQADFFLACEVWEREHSMGGE